MDFAKIFFERLQDVSPYKTEREMKTAALQFTSLGISQLKRFAYALHFKLEKSDQRLNELWVEDPKLIHDKIFPHFEVGRELRIF